MRHTDAYTHLRGESQYIDDIPAPSGMLYGALYGSPVAHGLLRRLHLEEARAYEGVCAILTAADIPGTNQIGPIIADEPLLADSLLSYMAQPVALVIATTPEAARHAATLIRADIEEYAPITDPREAFAKGELIAPPRTFVLGDVEAAWASCDVIVQGSSHCNGQEHLYLETQRARAIPLEGRRYQIYSSTQGPYAVQKAVARILGLPQHEIEVDTRRLGGGFGGKEDQATPWACFAALGAWHLGRPVEVVLHRLDDLRMTGKRHPYVADFTMGLKADGTILAYDVRHFQNAGAKADLSTSVLERTLFHSTNSYFIPNVRAFAASCRTNLPPNTAFRGFGGPQGMFAIEAAITQAAEALGMPREAIQRKNLLKEGDLLPYGQHVERARAIASWDEAASAFDLEARRAAVDAFNQKNKLKKKGLAMMPICFGISFTTTFLNQASALVHVYTDGSVSVSTGGVEMGQGVNTKLQYIAAKTLGISPKRVKLESTNTTRIANMSPSAASATTDLNGHATILACQQIRERLLQIVAKDRQIDDLSRLSIAEDAILLDGASLGITWPELVLKAYLQRVALSAHAFFATPEIHFDKQKEKGKPFAYHVFGAALTEVTIDTLRGIYTIDAIQLVHDLGRSLHPLVDLGQVEGGLAQGVGWMTVEEMAYNEKGRLLSHALSTYKAPDVYLMPDRLDVRFIEDDNDPIAPYGSKAVGEPPLMYGIGCYFALRDAMRAFNKEAPLPFDAPLTPEKLLLQMHAAPLVKQELQEAGAKSAHPPQKTQGGSTEKPLPLPLHQKE